ncbi:MAG: hypothetical protein H9W81_08025 [Enterococcus sp.]|nr:hypothetical protein [Enterococcus sp.]
MEENVLNRNKDKYGEIEVRGFTYDVMNHPTSAIHFFSLELTYHETNTRIIVDYVASNGAPLVRSAEASAYRGEETDNVDYERLNSRLAQVAESR